MFFQDEARVGQKGRVCHRWYTKGQRPPGTADQRYTFAYIFAASEVETDNAFALVLPEVHTNAMQLFLDGAGWHRANALQVPECISLVALPAYSPELNPVERVWLYLKQRFLSHRLHADYEAIADAACRAWNCLTAETGRIRSLCSYPWIPQVGI